MKSVSYLMVIIFTCGLLSCSAPVTSPGRAPETRVSTPDLYQGELAWSDVEYVLHSSAVGRLITNDGENPYSVPVSFGYCQKRIYFHSSTMGKKMNNIIDNPKVAFVVDRYNEI